MNNKLVLIFGLLLQSFFVFSSDRNIPTHIVQKVPVQVVCRLENEADAQGRRKDDFIPAEGDSVQNALDIAESMDLKDAESVTAEVDIQEGKVYMIVTYPSGCSSLEAFHLK